MADKPSLSPEQIVRLYENLIDTRMHQAENPNSPYYRPFPLEDQAAFRGGLLEAQLDIAKELLSPEDYNNFENYLASPWIAWTAPENEAARKITQEAAVNKNEIAKLQIEMRSRQMNAGGRPAPQPAAVVSSSSSSRGRAQPASRQLFASSSSTSRRPTPAVRGAGNARPLAGLDAPDSDDELPQTQWTRPPSSGILVPETPPNKMPGYVSPMNKFDAEESSGDVASPMETDVSNQNKHRSASINMEASEQEDDSGSDFDDGHMRDYWYRSPMSPQIPAGQGDRKQEDDDASDFEDSFMWKVSLADENSVDQSVVDETSVNQNAVRRGAAADETPVDENSVLRGAAADEDAMDTVLPEAQNLDEMLGEQQNSDNRERNDVVRTPTPPRGIAPPIGTPTPMLPPIGTPTPVLPHRWPSSAPPTVGRSLERTQPLPSPPDGPGSGIPLWSSLLLTPPKESKNANDAVIPLVQSSTPAHIVAGEQAAREIMPESAGPQQPESVSLLASPRLPAKRRGPQSSQPSAKRQLFTPEFQEPRVSDGSQPQDEAQYAISVQSQSQPPSRGAQGPRDSQPSGKRQLSASPSAQKNSQPQNASLVAEPPTKRRSVMPQSPGEREPGGSQQQSAPSEPQSASQPRSQSQRQSSLLQFLPAPTGPFAGSSPGASNLQVTIPSYSSPGVQNNDNVGAHVDDDEVSGSREMDAIFREKNAAAHTRESTLPKSDNNAQAILNCGFQSLDRAGAEITASGAYDVWPVAYDEPGAVVPTTFSPSHSTLVPGQVVSLDTGPEGAVSTMCVVAVADHQYHKVFGRTCVPLQVSPPAYDAGASGESSLFTYWPGTIKATVQCMAFKHTDGTVNLEFHPDATVLHKCYREVKYHLLETACNVPYKSQSGTPSQLPSTPQRDQRQFLYFEPDDNLTFNSTIAALGIKDALEERNISDEAQIDALMGTYGEAEKAAEAEQRAGEFADPTGAAALKYDRTTAKRQMDAVMRDRLQQIAEGKPSLQPCSYFTRESTILPQLPDDEARERALLALRDAAQQVAPADSSNQQVALDEQQAADLCSLLCSFINMVCARQMFLKQNNPNMPGGNLRLLDDEEFNKLDESDFDNFDLFFNVFPHDAGDGKYTIQARIAYLSSDTEDYGNVKTAIYSPWSGTPMNPTNRPKFELATCDCAAHSVFLIAAVIDLFVQQVDNDITLNTLMLSIRNYSALQHNDNRLLGSFVDLMYDGMLTAIYNTVLTHDQINYEQIIRELVPVTKSVLGPMELEWYGTLDDLNAEDDSTRPSRKRVRPKATSPPRPKTTSSARKPVGESVGAAAAEQSPYAFIVVTVGQDMPREKVNTRKNGLNAFHGQQPVRVSNQSRNKVLEKFDLEYDNTEFRIRKLMLDNAEDAYNQLHIMHLDERGLHNLSELAKFNIRTDTWRNWLGKRYNNKEKYKDYAWMALIPLHKFSTTDCKNIQKCLELDSVEGTTIVSVDKIKERIKQLATIHFGSAPSDARAADSSSSDSGSDSSDGGSANKPKRRKTSGNTRRNTAKTPETAKPSDASPGEAQGILQDKQDIAGQPQNASQNIQGQIDTTHPDPPLDDSSSSSSSSDDEDMQQAPEDEEPAEVKELRRRLESIRDRRIEWLIDNRVVPLHRRDLHESNKQLRNSTEYKTASKEHRKKLKMKMATRKRQLDSDDSRDRYRYEAKEMFDDEKKRLIDLQMKWSDPEYNAEELWENFLSKWYFSNSTDPHPEYSEYSMSFVHYLNMCRATTDDIKRIITGSVEDDGLSVDYKEYSQLELEGLLSSSKEDLAKALRDKYLVPPGLDRFDFALNWSSFNRKKLQFADERWLKKDNKMYIIDKRFMRIEGAYVLHKDFDTIDRASYKGELSMEAMPLPPINPQWLTTSISTEIEREHVKKGPASAAAPSTTAASAAAPTRRSRGAPKRRAMAPEPVASSSAAAAKKRTPKFAASSSAAAAPEQPKGQTTLRTRTTQATRPAGRAAKQRKAIVPEAATSRDPATVLPLSSDDDVTEVAPVEHANANKRHKTSNETPNEIVTVLSSSSDDDEANMSDRKLPIGIGSAPGSDPDVVVMEKQDANAGAIPQINAVQYLPPDVMYASHAPPGQTLIKQKPDDQTPSAYMTAWGPGQYHAAYLPPAGTMQVAPPVAFAPANWMYDQSGAMQQPLMPWAYAQQGVPAQVTFQVPDWPHAQKEFPAQVAQPVDERNPFTGKSPKRQSRNKQLRKEQSSTKPKRRGAGSRATDVSVPAAAEMDERSRSPYSFPDEVD